MLLLGGFSSSATAQHRPKHRKQLRSELARIRGRKGQIRSQLRETRKKSHAVKVDIMTVDSEIVSAKDNLDQTRDRLAVARANQKDAAKNLKEATLELLKDRDLVRRRLRRVYMQGNENAISAFSGVRSGGEVAANGPLMRAIEEKDRQVFEHYILLQKRVLQEKRRKDSLVLQITGLESNQVRQTRHLADTRQEKAHLLADLIRRQSDLEASMAQFQVDEAKIAAQIAAYEREARARRGRPGAVNLGSFSGRFSRPVNAPITSTFGSRYHPILHRVRMHEGVDFGAGFGTPIHAAADGVVIFSSYMRGYGHVVILAHGGGFSTVYAHTSSVYCSNGQRVHRGQVIAAVGATGLATGPHLHFEVRVNGHAVNPLGHF